ncbi:MAG TPA: HAD-IA family hydrolase [Candidatus Cybelea sp.]|nr:HAD-IA family hydrolase [Candidatus Cybelea sp.]
MALSIRAVLWDFGGVILSSPFEAFNRYEDAHGLPRNFIRRLNATNPDTNAWAQLERSAVNIEEFCRLFEAEALAAGHRLDANHVLAILSGDIRPEMVAALKSVKQRYVVACLTNNVRAGDGPAMSRSPEKASAVAEIMALFDHVIESSRIGVRKPEPSFYRLACERLAIQPEEAVYLDDLGINLKPAKAMGMRTIKVESAEQAIAELEAVLGHPVR